MITNSILKAALEAKNAMGNHVKPIENPVILDIVNTYKHEYETVQDCLDNHDVDKRDFAFHDNVIEVESTKLATILKACIVTWNSEVKPLAQNLLNVYASNINETFVTEEVVSISINKIVRTPEFERMLDVERYAPPSLTKSLYDLSIDLGFKEFENSDETFEKLTAMLVESKCARPDDIIEYLSDIPSNLIIDVWNSVFVKRNINRFLPLDFSATNTDYLTKVAYGDMNFDKLLLTIMFANYLANNPVETLSIDLTTYETYFNTLFNASCSQAGVWLKTIDTYIKAGVISPYAFINNGITIICVNENAIVDLPEDMNVMELVMAMSKIKDGGIVTKEDLADPEMIKLANQRIDAVITYRNEQLKRQEIADLDSTIRNDAMTIGREYTAEDARIIGQYEHVYQRMLKWIAISRYQGTYIDILIHRYLELSAIDEELSINLLNGRAIASLAAYIVTH